MTKNKKRLSKKAKEALKIIEESKLLENSKTMLESQANQNFNSTEPLVKTSVAHKSRPNKKRG